MNWNRILCLWFGHAWLVESYTNVVCIKCRKESRI